MELDISFIKSLILLGFLSLASLQDLRSRYVSDIIWIAAGIALIPIIFFEVMNGQFDLFATILSAAFAMGVSFPLSRIGFLGEADAFALTLLSLYMPALDNKEILLHCSLCICLLWTIKKYLPCL